MSKISKKSEKKTPKGQTDASGIDEFYRSESMSIAKPLISSGSGIRIFYLISALIFGLGGGIIGGSLSDGYLSLSDFKVDSLINNKTALSNNQNQQVIVFQSSDNDTIESNLGILVETAGASVIGIFPKKVKTGNIWQDVYLPEEQLGNGLVITNDGWIMTIEGIVEQEEDLVVVLADRKIFTVTQKVVDRATGAVFLKIDAGDLKVVKFGARDKWSPGEELLILANALSDGGLKLNTSAISDANFQPIGKGQDFLKSTEIYKKRILISPPVSADFIGGPVINKKGEIVGLMTASKSGNIVLPADYFSAAVKSLLSVGEIMRPALGVYYLDLAHILGLSTAITEGRTQGAVLYGEKGVNLAVKEDSAAQKAGLKAGDIILSVNNEALDARHSLTELVQEYRIGDVLKLDVVNQGKERKVEVVLIGEELVVE